MNDMQFEAVTTVNGPLLILAGAGSGKTTVLVNRIANLVKFGDGYRSTYCPAVTDEDIKAGEDYLNGVTDFVPNGVFSVRPVRPWQILAITFTNKAAGELKERIAARLGEDANDIWAGTFHSVCGRILRRYAESIGYTSHFTIYDTDDQRRLMKQIMKAHEIDEKFLPPKRVLSAISDAKEKLISPAEYKAQAGDDLRLKTVAELYRIYQKRLNEADAMDFDDMIFNTVRLLQNDTEALNYCTGKFRYVMVDEYQDTNHAQYELVRLLSSGENNICVPVRLTGTGNLFMLEVKGDSMIDAAICDGDFVVVREQHNAENGDIVAALLDDEATVKTFRQEHGHTWLIPHNPNYAPIDGTHAQIMGKVVTVLRKI